MTRKLSELDPLLIGLFFFTQNHTINAPTKFVGRDSSVDIATRYELDGPGDRIPVGARFFASVQTCPGAHPASYTMGTGSVSRV